MPWNWRSVAFSLHILRISHPRQFRVSCPAAVLPSFTYYLSLCKIVTGWPWMGPCRSIRTDSEFRHQVMGWDEEAICPSNRVVSSRSAAAISHVLILPCPFRYLQHRLKRRWKIRLSASTSCHTFQSCRDLLLHRANFCQQHSLPNWSEATKPISSTRRWNVIMLDGSICTPEEQALFNSSRGTSIVCLTRGDSIGLTLVAESGFISLIAVLCVFVLILVSMVMLTSFSTLNVQSLLSAMPFEMEHWFDIRRIYIWWGYCVVWSE